MEIQLSPESEARLADLARSRGEDPAVVAGELVALGLEQQQLIAKRKQEIRDLLSKRWDDYRRGKSVPIDSEDVRREMKAKNQAARARGS